MNSFTQTGSMQESSGNEGTLFHGWQGGSGYSPEHEVSAREGGDAEQDALEMRLALLARAIEHEIVPRLMLAHRSPAACLPLPEIANDRVNQDDVQEFSKLVLSPEEDLALPCVAAMRARGISVETIYLDLLAPVARYLGKLWDEDLCDFTEVTMGLSRLHRVLRELSPAFSRSGDSSPNGRRVLLLPAPGEQHTFGLVMVAEFFRRAGWDVAGGPWDAGGDPSLMVQREWFDVVGFSMANHLHLEELGDCIRKVRKSALNPNVGIMVGGPAFATNPEYADLVDADAAANDGSKAPAIAEKLASSHRDRV
jgi:MerR family transcriptional regulator, light-induced transcriptional regulator